LTATTIVNRFDAGVRTRTLAAERLRVSSPDTTRENKMAFAIGTAVLAQANSTTRAPRTGVVEEVLRGDPSPRYRIRWDDGHETTITPSSGTLQRKPRRARAKQPR
jgi:hypothetical protein